MKFLRFLYFTALLLPAFVMTILMLPIIIANELRAPGDAKRFGLALKLANQRFLEKGMNP